ncbi:MAG: hypothetical protein LBN22_06760 [Clostridiales Family XIII bacterium]|jgi:molybdopterin-guanine dinucleotide biosynthesis protein B|nr:hypothetical protein [Clostridiales Family XIII bacterium]
MYEVGTECNSGNRKTTGEIILKIDGEELVLVPFVQNILKDTILAITKELNGYKEDCKIEITIC